jgi:hypothetical protein
MNVIPGRPEGPDPESMNTGLWNMGSGLAAPLGARVRAPVGWCIFDAPGRPGMTMRAWHHPNTDLKSKS